LFSITQKLLITTAHRFRYMLNTKTDTIIVRYDEIGLKGKNRFEFEKKLVDNIRLNLKSNNKEFSSINRIRGRIIIKSAENAYSLKDVFGISSFSHAKEAAMDIESIKKEVIAQIKDTELNKDNTFCIRCQRVDKSFKKTSLDVEREIGEIVVNETGAKVKLKDPMFTFYIELVEGMAYLFHEKIKAYGGLPVGSSSKVATLLSTGIDSPVAAWMAMKRGCTNVYVFNYNYPFADKKEKEYAKGMFNILKRFDPKSVLYIVNFGKIQEHIKDSVNQRLRCIICKRFMYRVANSIAEKEGAKAIITGEAIGQVASQTIENIYCENKASELPVLRPLIGMNKQEIINLAKEIGTFEASTKTSGKCGLLPSCPLTKGRIEHIEKEEEKMDIESIVMAAVEDAEIVK